MHIDLYRRKNIIIAKGVIVKTSFIPFRNLKLSTVRKPVLNICNSLILYLRQ